MNVLAFLFCVPLVYGFTTCPAPAFKSSSAASLPSTTRLFADETEFGIVGSGPNWIERSFPVDTKEGISLDPKAVEDYNLGLSGVDWGVGPLSLRMYDTMTERSSALDQADAATAELILRSLKIYAMDFTSKEAVKQALNQNGLQMVLTEDEEDMELWGSVDSIRLLDEKTGDPIAGRVYDDWEDAVDDWIPGQPFAFVVRNVPAKMRELTAEEVLRAIKPIQMEGEESEEEQ